MRWFRRHTDHEPAGPSLAIDQEPPAVIQKISPRDQMYSGDRAHYFGVGRSALRCIRLAMLAAGKQHALRILDLPCGHGRVMRYLRANFLEAQMTACDLDRDAVDFCACEFGATPVYSSTNIGEIPLSGRYDLIWCGSLLTHLDADGWAGFLGLFRTVLEPGGLLLFTAHGREAHRRITREGSTYQLTPEAAVALVDSYSLSSFGYQDYPHSPGFGVSLALASWVVMLVESIPQLRLLGYLERGWDNHQDVVACLHSVD